MAAAWWRLYEENGEKSHPLRRTDRRYFLLLGRLRDGGGLAAAI